MRRMFPKDQPIAGQPRLAAAVLLACMMSPAACLAALPDGESWRLSASQGLSYDSNLFRLADGRRPVGDGPRSDKRSVTTLGLEADIESGRQRLYASFDYSLVRYDEYDQLDYDGQDYRADWSLGFGSDSRVGVGYRRTRQLSDFADLVTQRGNVVTNQSLLIDMQARAGGDWRWVAALSQGDSTNTSLEEKRNDNDSRYGEAGTRYLSRAGNYVDLRFRATDYDYPQYRVLGFNGTQFFTQWVSNDFKQYDTRLSWRWRATGASVLSGGVNQVRRTYDSLGYRNFGDWTGNLAWAWTPNGSTTVSLNAARDVGAQVSGSSTYSVTHGVGAGLGWMPTGRLRFQAGADLRWRDYAGYLNPAEPPREDRTTTLSLTGYYSPLRALQFMLDLRYDLRDSNLPLAEYSAWSSFISLQFSY